MTSSKKNLGPLHGGNLVFVMLCVLLVENGPVSNQYEDVVSDHRHPVMRYVCTDNGGTF